MTQQKLQFNVEDVCKITLHTKQYRSFVFIAEKLRVKDNNTPYLDYIES